MFIVDNSPVVKNLDFIIQFSKDNNSIVLSGNKVDDLYKTPISSPTKSAKFSVNSHHFSSLKDVVYYFNLVFNCPGEEAFCGLIS